MGKYYHSTNEREKKRGLHCVLLVFTVTEGLRHLVLGDQDRTNGICCYELPAEVGTCFFETPASAPAAQPIVQQFSHDNLTGSWEQCTALSCSTWWLQGDLTMSIWWMHLLPPRRSDCPPVPPPFAVQLTVENLTATAAAGARCMASHGPARSCRTAQLAACWWNTTWKRTAARVRWPLSQNLWQRAAARQSRPVTSRPLQSCPTSWPSSVCTWSQRSWPCSRRRWEKSSKMTRR